MDYKNATEKYEMKDISDLGETGKFIYSRIIQRVWKLPWSSGGLVYSVPTKLKLL